METWLFEIELFLPMAQTAIGLKGGLPERLEFSSIYSSDDAPIKLAQTIYRLTGWPKDRESKAPKNTFPNAYESVNLQVESRATNEDQALNQVRDQLEAVLERIVFLIQLPIGIGVVIQTNPNASKKCYSDYQILIKPDKYPIRHSCELSDEPNWLSLSICAEFSDEKINRAMHWYAKAVSETDIFDRFIYLWISLEILCNREGVKVKKPYVAPCGCLIESCPTCGKITEKQVNGDSIKQYLIENLGIQSDIASSMWQLRQMVHGQRIKTGIERDASNLTRVLYGAVSAALKLALGLSHDDRPLPPRNPMFGGGFLVRIDTGKA